MKLVKGFFVLYLCVLLGTCFSDDGVLEIDIGDYEAQLSAWNSLNMLNYQLLVDDNTQSEGHNEIVVIHVKNGIPESIEPPSSWLEKDGLTTIPEFFDYIKKAEKRMRDGPKNKYKSLRFMVHYHSELYYPIYIGIDETGKGSGMGNYAYSSYNISLTPLGENCE
jgi:hypothetical protein